MTERSATRRELEHSLRAMVPSAQDFKILNQRTPTSTVAAAGGLLVGYAWGWIRGRRPHARRSR